RMVLAGTDPGSPHAVLPSAEVIAALNHPHLTTQELVSLIFPQTPAGLRAAGAYARRVGSQQGLRESWFRSPPNVVRQQVLAEGLRWIGPGRGAYGALPRVRIPTLVADGALDLLEPPENSRIIASRLPNARLRIY